jgi:hypothetical protein
MSDVPDVSGQEMAVSALHHVSLEATFCDQKAASKPSRDAFYAILVREIKKLCRSDPRRSSPLTPSPVGDISFARD